MEGTEKETGPYLIPTDPQELSAWVIEWDSCGDHAKRPKGPLLILSSRWGSERVRDVMIALYVQSEYELSDQVEYAKGKLKPHTESGRSALGYLITCGDTNPSLAGFLVDDLVVTMLPDGTQKVTYNRRPMPEKKVREQPKLQELRNSLSTAPRKLGKL